jgi:hypothetical protein
VLHLQAREGLALQIEAKVDWLLPRVYCPMAFFNSIDKWIKKSIWQKDKENQLANRERKAFAKCIFKNRFKMCI